MVRRFGWVWLVVLGVGCGVEPDGAFDTGESDGSFRSAREPNCECDFGDPALICPTLGGTQCVPAETTSCDIADNECAVGATCASTWCKHPTSGQKCGDIDVAGTCKAKWSPSTPEPGPRTF